MLTELDDTLMHQAPLPFALVASSDHRFFDRYWFEAVAPDGSLCLIMGMGRYRNMNVLDGFVSIQTDAGRQYNLRFSRALEPDVTTPSVGGLTISVVKPLEVLRLVLSAGNHPMSCDLTWTGNLPARLESHQFSRQHGRVVSDFYRFAQMGEVSGWVAVAGRRAELQGWFGARDHSWGVRAGVGGFEPVTAAPDPAAGRFFLWLAFRIDDFGGYLQLLENQDGDLQSRDGSVVWPADSGRSEQAIARIEHELTFHAGTRQFDHGRLTVTTVDGDTLRIDIEPVLTAWAYRGTGYGNGYNDGLGLGVYRGEYLEESDIYDVSDPEIVRDLQGERIASGHREQPVKIKVDGKPGFGHCTVIAMGTYRRYGL